MVDERDLAEDGPLELVCSPSYPVGCLDQLPLMGEGTGRDEVDGVGVGPVVKADQRYPRLVRH